LIKINEEATWLKFYSVRDNIVGMRAKQVSPTC